MAGFSQIPDPLDQLRGEKRRMEKIRQYLSENMESDLKLIMVADKFELSVSSLQHLFKKHQQKTYHRYLEDTRLEKAFDMITLEGKRIKEAMYATGYKNRVTFNIAFKKKFKHPPGHFRK
jgi:AraC-like DNA-binding protein